MDPFSDLPDENTTPLYACVRCGRSPIQTRICVDCHNACILALRLDVSESARSDWIYPRYNHVEMMQDAAFVEWLMRNGGHIPWSYYVRLIMKRAELHGF